MTWAIAFRTSAEKEFRRLDRDIQARVANRPRKLVDDPHSGERLESSQTEYRVRIGDWRAVYEIDEPAHEVVITSIGKRGEIYKVRRRQH